MFKYTVRPIECLGLAVFRLLARNRFAMNDSTIDTEHAKGLKQRKHQQKLGQRDDQRFTIHLQQARINIRF